MDGQWELTGLRGTLRQREEEGGVRFSVRAEDPGNGLYKVWLTGGGRELLLGTLIPEGDGLALDRRLSRRELERAGWSPGWRGEARRAFSFAQTDGWSPAEDLKGLLKDRVLRASAGEVRGALLRREGENTHLAVPFEEGRPFPLTALICLGTPVERAGRNYLRFTFDREGRPIMTEKGEAD